MNHAVASPPRRRFSRWIQFGLPILGLTLLWLLYHEVPILFTSLMVAWGFYYILNPIVDWLESRSLSRLLASAVVLIALVAVMYVIWLRFVTFSADLRRNMSLDVVQKNLVSAVQRLIVKVETRAPILTRFIEPRPQPSETSPADAAKTPGAKSRAEKLRAAKPVEPVLIARPLADRIQDFILAQVVARAPEFAKILAGLLPNLILIPYFTFFFLKDGRVFKKTLIEWIPNRYFEPALKFFYEMDRRMRSYLQNLMLDCLLVGVLVGVGSAAVGAPYPVMFGLIAMVLNSIPLVGPLLYGSICLLILIGLGGSTDLILGFVSVFLLSRICDDLIFIPAIFGRSHHLHPVLVVCAVLLGGNVAGAWGMFLAIPIVSILFLGLGIIREISAGEDPLPLPPSAFTPFA